MLIGSGLYNPPADARVDETRDGDRGELRLVEGSAGQTVRIFAGPRVLVRTDVVPDVERTDEEEQAERDDAQPASLRQANERAAADPMSGHHAQRMNPSAASRKAS
jgi:hypothetical protein